MISWQEGKKIAKKEIEYLAKELDFVLLSVVIFPPLVFLLAIKISVFKHMTPNLLSSKGNASFRFLNYPI